MRSLFDTSILIASFVETHPQHSVALQALQQSDPTDVQMVAAHSLAEIYATLTRLPPPLRMSSQQAFGLIEKNVLSAFEVVSLSVSDYVDVLRHLAENNLVSGIIYDALILRAGMKANADRILTLNPRHFRSIDPALADRIVDPSAPLP